MGILASFLSAIDSGSTPHLSAEQFDCRSCALEGKRHCGMLAMANILGICRTAKEDCRLMLGLL
jgi:hypothetical protein